MEVTGKIYLYAYQGRHCSKHSFGISDNELNGEGFVTIDKKEVTFEAPDDFDIRPNLVAQLREEQQTLRAEVEQKVTRIEERIQSLLALEAPPVPKIGDDAEDIPF